MTGDPPPSGSSLRLTALLVAAMAAATIPLYVLGILATFIIDDLGITRSELGFGVTVNVLLAALLSPTIGGLTDRLGGRRATMILFVLSGAGLAIIAGAPVYAWLLVGSVVAAVAQAFGNPATNKLIAVAVPAGRRGLVTGIKQSGVQVGVFVGGLVLPVTATAFGWRPTLAGLAVVVACGIVLSALVRLDEARGERTTPTRSGHVPAIRWLAAYGALLGFGGSTSVFIALFVEEGLGGTPEDGGLAVAIGGLAAIGARIALARVAERRRAYRATLGAIAGVGAATCSLFVLAVDVTWLVWPAAVLFGLSVVSWNSVGMLATIAAAGPLRAGSASGVVMLGFLGGIGIGAPVFGWTIDVTGSYTTMWVAAALTLLVGLGTMRWWSTMSPGALASTMDEPVASPRPEERTS